MDNRIIRCRAAATRAYRELRQKGISDKYAFDAALRIFGHHCPERAPEALDIVAAWVDDSVAEAHN